MRPAHVIAVAKTQITMINPINVSMFISYIDVATEDLVNMPDQNRLQVLVYLDETGLPSIE
jgi:hypothetical protein